MHTSSYECQGQQMSRVLKNLNNTLKEYTHSFEFSLTKQANPLEYQQWRKP